MGDLRGTARSAQAAMTAESRRASTQRDRIARDEIRHKQRLDIEAVRTARDADRNRTSAALAASRERMAAANREGRAELARQQTSAQLFIAAERAKTRAAEREGRARQRSAESIERNIARVRRQAAAETRRYEDDVDRRRLTTAGSVVRGGVAVGRAAGAFASGVHSDIQGERRTRATANRGLRYALRGAGIEGSYTSAQREVAAFTERTGMEYGDVVGALRLGQQRGSALETRGRSPEEAIRQALRVVEDANASDIDPGQLLAARGRLGSAGLSGTALDDSMRYIVHAAERGSVEVDQIIQQGMPGIQRLMGSRVAGVSPEQRQQAAVAALRESVATQEVFANTGVGPTRASNTLANLQSFMSTPRRQDLMRTNLENYARGLNRRSPEGAQRYNAIQGLLSGPDAIFERDPTRRGNAQRLRGSVANAPLLLADRVTEAMGGNSQAAANIFAGGGHGNAQSFLVNMRNMLESMGQINPETGQRRSASIRNLMEGNVSPAEMERRRDANAGDELANINRVDERRAQALTNNTDAVVNLSNRFNDWAKSNPFAAQGVSAGTGLAGTLAGGVAAGAIATRGAAVMARVAPAVGTARAVLGGLNALTATTSTGAQALTVAAGLGVAGVAGKAINASMGHTQQSDNPFSSNFYSEFARSVRDAIRDGIAQAPINATIDSHTARHAAADNATTPARRP